MSIICSGLDEKGQEWKRILEIESIVKSGASLKCGQVSWLMQVLRDLKSSLSKENICCWRPTSRKENTCTAWLWSSWLCLDGRNRSGKWKPELVRVCFAHCASVRKTKCGKTSTTSAHRPHSPHQSRIWFILVLENTGEQSQRKQRLPKLKISLFCTFSYGY